MASLGCSLFFGLGFVLIFDGLIGYQFYQLYHAQNMYQKVQGDVVVSEVESKYSSDGTTHRAEIEFVYSVQGQEYRGDRYSYFNWGGSSSRDAWEVAQRYTVGDHVQVYYDPSTPSKSVLELDSRSFPSLLLIFLTPFHCVGAGFIWEIWVKSRLRHLGDDAQAARDLVCRRISNRLVMCDSKFPGWILFFMVFGGTAFVSFFILAFISGFQSPRSLVVSVWLGCFGVAGALAIWHLLDSRKARRLLVYDQLGGWISRRGVVDRLSVSEIKSLWVESAKTNVEINDEPRYKHTIMVTSLGGSDYPILRMKGKELRGELVCRWMAQELGLDTEQK